MAFCHLTRKVTLAWTLKFPVLLWNDWTGRQSDSMIGKQHSQLCRIGKGGAQCRLPHDLPVKSGSWIYFVNVGIRLLMHSWKLCCVPNFGDFCSWKRSFGVGKYAKAVQSHFPVDLFYSLFVCVCVSLCVCVCVCICWCVHVCLCVYSSVCMCVYMHVYVYMHVCVCVG